MANDSTTVFVSGRLFWAKIVGERALVPNYDGDSREWAFEFEPDDTSFLKEHGLLDRLKEKEDLKNPDKGRYLIFRKPEFNRDGEKNEGYRIYDADNQPWGEERLIGNGSKADLKIRIRDWGRGKKDGVYAQAIRITDLVPYITSEFAGMDSNASFEKPSKAVSKPKAKTKVDETDNFDDDIPPFE